MKNVKKSSFILFSIIILILILALTFVVGNVWGISFVQEADQSSNNLNVASSSAKYETIGSTTNESTNNVIHTFKSLFSESYFSYVLDNENKAKIIGFQNSNNDDYIYIPNKIPGTYYDVVSIQSGALDKCINDLRLASLPFKGIYVEEGIEVCGEQLFNNPLIIETNPRIDFQDSKKPSGFNTFNYHINRLVAIVSNILYSVDKNR